MNEHPETILAGVMNEAVDLDCEDLFQIACAIEEFNQMMGLPSLLWDDAVRIANFTDRGRQ